MKRLLGVALTLILAATVGVVGIHAADDSLLRTEIFGDQTLAPVRGVNSAGNPWVTEKGKAKLRANGDLEVEIKGLVIAAGLNQAGLPVPAAVVGTNPVAQVTVVVSWMAQGGTVFQSTPLLPLSPQGNLKVKTNVGPRPVSGERPIIMVRAGGAGPYIGISNFIADFGSSDCNGHGHDHDD